MKAFWEPKEYSKKIISGMILLWFLGAGYGFLVIAAETVAALLWQAETLGNTTLEIHLPELLTYIGTPMGCGIVGYLAKAAFENREKIRLHAQSYEEASCQDE